MSDAAKYTLLYMRDREDGSRIVVSTSRRGGLRLHTRSAPTAEFPKGRGSYVLVHAEELIALQTVIAKVVARNIRQKATKR